jgi:hypothetical protein
MKAIVHRARTAVLLARLIYGVVAFILACGFQIFSKLDGEMLRWQWPVISHHEIVVFLTLVVAFVLNLEPPAPAAAPPGVAQ